MFTVPFIQGILGCVIFALTTTFFYILAKMFYLRTRTRSRADRTVSAHKYKLAVESIIGDLSRAYFSRVKEEDRLRIDGIEGLKEKTAKKRLAA